MNDGSLIFGKNNIPASLHLKIDDIDGFWKTYPFDGRNPKQPPGPYKTLLNKGISIISTGAGFLPSSVSFPFCGWLLDSSYVSLVQRLVITACLIDGHIIDGFFRKKTPTFQRHNIQQHQLSTVDKHAFQVSHQKNPALVSIILVV